MQGAYKVLTLLLAVGQGKGVSILFWIKEKIRQDSKRWGEATRNVWGTQQGWVYYNPINWLTNFVFSYTKKTCQVCLLVYYSYMRELLGGDHKYNFCQPIRWRASDEVIRTVEFRGMRRWKWKNESRQAFLEAALREETGGRRWIKEQEANSQLVSPPVGKHGLSNCCFQGLL